MNHVIKKSSLVADNVEFVTLIASCHSEDAQKALLSVTVFDDGMEVFLRVTKNRRVVLETGDFDEALDCYNKQI